MPWITSVWISKFQQSMDGDNVAVVPVLNGKADTIVAIHLEILKCVRCCVEDNACGSWERF